MKLVAFANPEGFGAFKADGEWCERTAGMCQAMRPDLLAETMWWIVEAEGLRDPEIDREREP